MSEYAALLLMVLLTCFGQVMMKKGAVRVVYDGGFRRLLRTFANPYVFWGAAASLIAPFFYIYALTGIDLAVAYSFTGLNYVLVLLASRYVLHEQINRWQGAGILLIFAGVVVFNA